MRRDAERHDFTLRHDVEGGSDTWWCDTENVNADECDDEDRCIDTCRCNTQEGGIA